jgi:hypothetical protein
MTKAALLKELEASIDDAARTRMWGTVEIQFNDGEPALIRKSETKKLITRTGEQRAHDRYNR